MKQPMYVHAASAISPQNTFNPQDFLSPVITSENCRLYALEAPYANYISPVAIRRMSRIMKMTISAAMQCLKDAGVSTPDAIVTGTGRGGVTDMQNFVKDMIRLEEGALNPTGFIQSTYNSPNGWIAMQSTCTGYNQTYVHRGCSFELALLDAQMLLAEAGGKMNILTGCYDEMTEEYFTIRNKINYWKKEKINNLTLLLNARTAGTIGGEGAAFFLLNRDPEGAIACIESVRIIQHADNEQLRNKVENALEEAEITPNELSLVLLGLNGDKTQTELYESTLRIIPKAVPVAAFKHLCGEYDTAAGFGLWLLQHMIKTGYIANQVLINGDNNSASHNFKALFVNHFILGTASVILVSGKFNPSLTSN